MPRFFFVVTLIAAGSYMMRKRQIEAAPLEQAARAAKSTAQTVLADPMLVAAGIQVVRAIGVKKLIPILAVGGLALGFLASRANASGSGSEAPAEYKVRTPRGRCIEYAAAYPRHCETFLVP